MPGWLAAAACANSAALARTRAEKAMHYAAWCQQWAEYVDPGLCRLAESGIAVRACAGSSTCVRDPCTRHLCGSAGL